jgi:hypothetical protein
MYFANSLLSTPKHSKSAASPFACCEFSELPIARQSSLLRYPLEIAIGLPKCLRVGSKTCTASSVKFSTNFLHVLE